MKPILFSTEMVKAILDGRKSQTRRVIKPQPDENGVSYMERPPALDWEQYYNEKWKVWHYDTDEGEDISTDGKYMPGDILWVRETWYPHMNTVQGSYAYTKGETVKYPPHFLDKNGVKRCVEFKADYPKAHLKWKPSIFMSREACRIFLEVTDVRVERLQDISEQNAAAEGLQDYYGKNAPYHTNKVRYIDLWDEINGKKYPWSSNPWVWVITFKRIEKP